MTAAFDEITLIAEADLSAAPADQPLRKGEVAAQPAVPGNVIGTDGAATSPKNTDRRFTLIMDPHL
jgi:hypothetical protein